MSDEQEKENFYRHSTVIVDETKDSFLHLIDFHLHNQGTAGLMTLQTFIKINEHEIYHLCYNRYPCCLCPPGTRAETRGIRVLHPPQLEIFFDKTGTKLPMHNPQSKSAPHCCCPVNPKLQLQDLDITLARLLLVNFTKLVPPGSSERNALDLLVNSRNHSFAHAKSGKISDSEYKKSMSDIEMSLLVLAKVYGKETETKQRLRDIDKQPLNTKICLQLQNTLLQQCQLEEKVNKLLGENTLPEYLTKDLEDIKITEGCDARLELWTAKSSVNVEWFKGNNKIEVSNKYVMETCFHIHSLVVINCGLADRGMYTLKFLDYERSARLEIEEYFTKNLQSIECTEGEMVEFVCEIIEYGLPAHWSKNGYHLKHEGKYEILQAGRSYRLAITNCERKDAGDYTVNISKRVRTASLVVKEYFTQNMDGTTECIEGDNVELLCAVVEDSVNAVWEKNSIVVQHSDKYQITDEGKSHSMLIINSDLHDQGNYSVTINKRVRFTSLNVREYFTKNPQSVECTEGEMVEFECEIIEDCLPARWSKNGYDLKHEGKFEILQAGKTHRLVITSCDLKDAGDYTVNINKRVRTASLVVKELPAAIQQLSDKDKGLYLDIIKAGTETRYFIRIVIIGENGVGKTCLLRRLLGEPIDDVESTDGVDIVHRCKIRLSDGHWVFDGVSDKRKAILSRIRRAVNSKTAEVVHIQEKLYSQNDQTMTLENASVEGDIHIQDKLYSQNNQTYNSENASVDEETHIQDKLYSQNIRTSTFENSSLEEDTSIQEKLYSHSGTLFLEGRDSDNDREVEVIEALYSQSNPLQVRRKQFETKLEKVLTDAVLNELSHFLNDIEKFDIQEEVFLDCGFWDFAGQRQYYATHPIFLNPNAVHLLVANIMKDIKQINTEDGFDKIGEYFDYWFDSVHACRDVEDKTENSGDYLNPPVIVVCTGIDNCKNNLVERLNIFRQGLLTLLKNEDKLKHLRRICVVSNTEPSDADFDYLRKSIFEFGREMKTFGEKLPLRWIRLERSLDIIREAGVNILSWPDMTDLSFKCSIFDKEEIILFLNYQHKVGSIIYFESLDKNIILNPKWLADAFRCLVSINYSSDITLSKEWNMLEDTGRLDPALIEKLFQKYPGLEFFKHQEHLLSVMELFGIIVKLTTLLEDGQKQSSLTYYMPCMISKQALIAEINTMFNVEKENCKRTPWLCVEFAFMPFDFFNHILCYYIRQYPVCNEPFTNRLAIYHGLGVFFLDDDKTKSRKFVLCFSKNTIAIQLWEWKKIEQAKYKAMLKEIISVILEVKDKYEPRKVSYRLKLKCPEGNIHSPHGRLSYTDVVELGDNEYFCEEHSKCHNTNDFFQTWLADCSEVFQDKIIAGIPMELLQLDKHSASVFTDLLKEESYELFELRSILQGEQGTGKSTIARFLAGKGPKKIPRSTDGIHFYAGLAFFDDDTGEWIGGKQVFKMADITFSRSVRSFQQKRDGLKKDFHKRKLVPVTICDLGQDVFCSTHQTFVTYRAVYMLILDGSRTLNEPCRHEQFLPGKTGIKTQKDYVRFWINTIISYCKGDYPRFPKIMVILTHKDKLNVTEIDAKRSEIFGEIERMFSRSPIEQHLVIKDRIFVNARNSDDPEMEQIKKSLIHQARNQPTWGQKLPKCFLQLELEIEYLVKKGVTLIYLEDIKKINSQQPDRPLSMSELNVFLKFQHLIGNILYFDEPYLDQHIIISRTYLIDAFKSIITVRQLFKGDKKKQEACHSIEKKGIILKQTVEAIWKQKKYGHFFKCMRYLLEVMTRLDILVMPLRYDSFHNRKPTEFYYVASMIRKQDSTGYLQSPSFSERNIALCFSPSSSTIPPALYYRFISYCLSIWGVKTYGDNNEDMLFHWSAVFAIDPSLDMHVQCEEEQLIVRLVHRRHRTLIMKDLASGIRECLFAALHKINQRCIKTSSENIQSFDVKMCCSSSMEPCFVAVQDIGDVWICSRHQIEHGKDLILSWFTNKGEATCESCCPETDQHFLRQIPTDLHLRRLALEFSMEEIRKLVIQLGLPIMIFKELQYSTMRNETIRFTAIWKCKTMMSLTFGDIKIAAEREDIFTPHTICKVLRDRHIDFDREPEKWDLTPTDEDFDKLAHLVGASSLVFLLELGLTFQDWEHIEYSVKERDLVKLNRKIMDAWRTNCKVHNIRPTLRTIGQAFGNIGIQIKMIDNILFI